MSQQDLANILGVSPDHISRWEQEEDVTDIIPARILHRLASYLSMSMEDLINWTPETTENIFQTGFGDPLADRTRRIAILDGYTSKRLDEIAQEAAQQQMRSTIELVTQLQRMRLGLSHRPLIALLGAFDSGKSSFANVLLDANTIPVAWQPLTASPVLLRHKDARPSCVPENHELFLIYAHDGITNPPQFDFRQVDDAQYMSMWRIEPANREDLVTRTTHQNQASSDERPSAVLVLSAAPVLKYCDIVDTPGFDAGMEDGHTDQDAALAEKVTREADGFLLMSTANGFLKGQDILRMNDLLRRPVPLYLPDGSPLPLGHALMVATQADIDPAGVSEMLDTAANRVFGPIRRDGTRGPSQLAQVAFEYCQAEYKQPLTYADFRTRLVPFSTKRADLQRDLREALQNKLLVPIIDLLQIRQNEIVDKFNAMASSVLSNEIKRYEAVINERNETQRRLDHAKATREPNRARLRTGRDEVIVLINQVREDTANQVSTWWSRTINPENVEAEIRRRGYGRKEAQEHICQNLVDMAKDQVITTLNEAMKNRVEPKLNTFFESYKEYTLRDLSVGKAGEEPVPFDFQGAVAGGLTSAAVLGGLAIWASSFGSLGWYILAAKGISVLSALGISVGGTAAGISAMAALGGPILWAVGLAVLTGILIWNLFGKSWQRRLAEKACEVMNQKDMLSGIVGDINSFWGDTKKGVEHVAQHLEARIDEHIADMEHLLQETRPEEIEQLIDRCHAHKSFFEQLPWSTG